MPGWMDMTRLKQLTILALVGAAAVAGLNQFGTPVPGLTWLRADTALAKLGIGSPPAADPAVASTDGKGKRGGNSGGRRGGADGPAPVVVAAATIDDVPVYLRGVGSARAPQTVTVKPQVDGKLIKVYFREGQDVKKGDLLAEIDPVTFQASLDQAIAKRKQDEALLANTKVDLERYAKTGPGVTAQKTIDTQRSQVDQYEAQLRADAAAVANAQAIVDYTKITSPLDGRTGQRLVDEGNIVHASDAGLVTIAQIKPIQVQFTLPQQQLAQVMAAMRAGAVGVEAMDTDDHAVLDSGALSFIDNAVDQTTGTVRMKAELPNEHLQLWPGQFANVRVKIDTLKGAITAPTAAVQRGPQGTFVYVVNGNDGGGKVTVGVHPVTVAQQDDKISVITKGLAAADKVVTSGFARLKDGAEVVITRTENKPKTEGNTVAAPQPAAVSTPQASSSAAPETGSTGENKPRPERLGRADDAGSTGEAGGAGGRRHAKRTKPPESALQ